VRGVRDRHGPADHTRIRTEAAAPQRVTQNHDAAGRTRSILRLGERASQDRRHTDEIEVLARHAHGVDPLGILAVAGKRGRRLRGRRHVRQAARVGLEVDEGEIAQIARLTLARSFLDGDERIGVTIRQRREQHCIDHCEHHDVGAQADGQREHGGERVRGAHAHGA